MSVGLTIASVLVLLLALLALPGAFGSPGSAGDPASRSAAGASGAAAPDAPAASAVPAGSPHLLALPAAPDLPAAPGRLAPPAPAGAPASTFAPGWLAPSAANSAIAFGAPAPPGSGGARGSLESNPFFQHARARISRLHVVSPELVRGGRPDCGALYFLKRAGVRTIIDLRDLKGKFDAEEPDAKALGLNYINMPMSHRERIPKSVIDRFLSIVKDPRMQPVYVHCQQGADRTGCMVAIYRIDRQGWGPTKAYQEMLSFNFHPILRNLTASVYEFGASKGRYEPMPPIEDAVHDLVRRAQWLMDNI